MLARGVGGGVEIRVKIKGQIKSKVKVKVKVKSQIKSQIKVKSATASLREALRGGLALLVGLGWRLAVCFLGAVLFPSVAASALRVQHAARGVNSTLLRTVFRPPVP